MNSHASQMPTRFPAGTKLVIESHRMRDGRQVFSRHLEFPNGTFFPLSSRTSPKSENVRRRARPHR